MRALSRSAAPGRPVPVTRVSCRLWSILLLWLTVLTAPAAPEYSVKAAYLHHFTSLVKWPAPPAGIQDPPLVIGVVGQDPFEGGLAAHLRPRSSTGRRLEVRHIKPGDTAGLRGCHILFVPATESAALAAQAVRGQPVLVVSDTAGDAGKGAMISFSLRNQRIRLEIHQAAARAAGLVISSDLLGIATLVPSP